MPRVEKETLRSFSADELSILSESLLTCGSLVKFLQASAIAAIENESSPIFEQEKFWLYWQRNLQMRLSTCRDLIELCLPILESTKDGSFSRSAELSENTLANTTL